MTCDSEQKNCQLTASESEINLAKAQSFDGEAYLDTIYTIKAKFTDHYGKKCTLLTRTDFYIVGDNQYKYFLYTGIDPSEPINDQSHEEIVVNANGPIFLKQILGGEFLKVLTNYDCKLTITVTNIRPGTFTKATWLAEAQRIIDLLELEKEFYSTKAAIEVWHNYKLSAVIDGEIERHERELGKTQGYKVKYKNRKVEKENELITEENNLSNFKTQLANTNSPRERKRIERQIKRQEKRITKIKSTINQYENRISTLVSKINVKNDMLQVLTDIQNYDLVPENVFSPYEASKNRGNALLIEAKDMRRKLVFINATELKNFDDTIDTLESAFK